MFKPSSITSTVLIVMLLNGCTPTRVNDKIKLSAPEYWQHEPMVTGNAKPVDLKHWWQAFQDPSLDKLISQALNANHDLKIAAARVREANAMVTVAESARYPTLDFFASGGREKRLERIIGVPGKQGIELKTPTSNAISGGLMARWEIDLFGARQLETEAVSAQAEGSKEAKQAVQVSLLAQVASHYFELRGVQQHLKVHHKTIQVQKEKLRALHAFYRAGLVQIADVNRQQAALHSAESVLPTLTAAEDTLIHRLGVLTGNPPAQLMQQLKLATVPTPDLPALPRLLPASLLSQRPDLRLAQTEVSTAAATLGVARADLLPKLVLSASGGFGALAVGGFSSLAESVYTLGSGLTAPIINAGRIRAHITAADARLEQVAIHYEKTFLLALEDVENAYVAYQSSLDQQGQLLQAQLAATQAVHSTQSLYQHGAGDYVTALEAQLNQLILKDAVLKSETARRVALVSLYRAFGGGWEPHEKHS